MGRDSLAWDSLSRKLWCIKNLLKFEKVKRQKSISVLYVSQIFIIDKYSIYVPKIVLKLSQQLSSKLSQNCLKIVSKFSPIFIHKIVRKIVQKRRWPKTNLVVYCFKNFNLKKEDSLFQFKINVTTSHKNKICLSIHICFIED